MEVLVARSHSELSAAYDVLSRAEVIGCDTETSGFTSASAKLFSIQFSDGEFNALVPISEGIEPAKLADLLCDPRITKVFHNAKFDLGFLTGHGCPVENVFDTMIAEKVLTRGADQSASLAETLYRYFAVDLDKAQRSKFNPRWDGVWTDELVHYALADVVHLPHLMREQMNWLEKLGLVDEFNSQMDRVLREKESPPAAG
jgi:ribonuclease D